MKIFGIDTTRKSANIFIYDTEEEFNYNLTMDENVKHSEGLFLYIEKALLECKLTLEDIDYLACVVGPGSFTGIRVGMSTIKGISKVLNKKVIPINTFEILSDKVKSAVILLNSTATSCYYAQIKNKAIVDTGVINKDQIIDKFGGQEFIILKDEQKLINLEYNNITIVDDMSKYYLFAIDKKISANEDYEFVPYYLQLSQAERNLKNE